jgi:hypothetical protein
MSVRECEGVYFSSFGRPSIGQDNGQTDTLTRTLQAYLGHRSINSTTRYAALAPGRFKNIWGKV